MPGLQLGADEALFLAEYLVQDRKPAFEGAFQAGDAGRGARLLQSSGCVACHTAPAGAGPSTVAVALTLPALAKVVPDRGCLAADPPAGAPRFPLSADDRAAIAAFLKSVAAVPLAHVAPAHAFYRTVETFRCTSCHDFDAARRPDDEAAERIPPLTGAGYKLRREWAHAVLTGTTRSRPWLRLRMPAYGPGNVGGVAQQLFATAGLDEPGPGAAPHRRTIVLGQRLVGTGRPDAAGKPDPSALACVTCHSYRNGRVTADDAARAPELTTMAARVRPEWFRRWLRDPSRIQPGTAMPSFFFDKGDAEAAATIDTLWPYLATGSGMPPPAGVGDRASYVLGAEKEPVVVRALLPDDVARGIAVGLPGNVSFAFDAGTSRLRYAWAGGFLDMQGLWSGRGGNAARIVGQRFYTAPAVGPLRLDAAAEATAAFRGYELRAGLPTFLYTLDGTVQVRETITALAGGLGVVRSFEITGADKAVTLVVAEDPNVAYASTVGPLVAGTVAMADGSKMGARVATVPAGARIQFTLTVRAREGK